MARKGSRSRFGLVNGVGKAGARLGKTGSNLVYGIGRTGKNVVGLALNTGKGVIGSVGNLGKGVFNTFGQMGRTRRGKRRGRRRTRRGGCHANYNMEGSPWQA